MTNNYTEQIASLLSGKLEIQNVSEEVIQIMLQEHPYSPYGHLINYLKAKSQRRDDTDKLLHTLAAYSPDRAWLQQVLNTAFKDVEAVEEPDQAIPSEARSPYLDEMLFEFDFNLPDLEDKTTELIESDEIKITNPEVKPKDQEEVQELTQLDEEITEPNSYINWLKTFESQNTVSEPVKEAELPVINQRSREGKEQIVEKTTRKDKDLFGGIITETLAELLANQGQTEKAIGMYERLTLIFPNKSAFFAAKIEQLKHNIT